MSVSKKVEKQIRKGLLWMEVPEWEGYIYAYAQEQERHVWDHDDYVVDHYVIKHLDRRMIMVKVEKYPDLEKLTAALREIAPLSKWRGDTSREKLKMDVFRSIRPCRV